MLEHTKKRRTDSVELHFIGPKEKSKEAVDALKALGFLDISDTLAWRELFPEFESEPDHAVALRAARKRAGLTQKMLAEQVSIPQGHLSQMENGRMGIGKERARRLAQALDVDYRVFL